MTSREHRKFFRGADDASVSGVASVVGVEYNDTTSPDDDQ